MSSVADRRSWSPASPCEPPHEPDLALHSRLRLRSPSPVGSNCNGERLPPIAPHDWRDCRRLRTSSGPELLSRSCRRRWSRSAGSNIRAREPLPWLPCSPLRWAMVPGCAQSLLPQLKNTVGPCRIGGRVDSIAMSLRRLPDPNRSWPQLSPLAKKRTVPAAVGGAVAHS